MCIIAYKPIGEKFPSKKQFRTMFANNPDGAGFMYADGDKVVIRKGFMYYDEFKKAVKPLLSRTDLAVVFHFRIATHGGINKAMTQPFPLTSKTKKLKSCNTSADVGIAHNGIIPMTYDARDISDTALFIKQYATWILRDGITSTALDIIETCIDSRMVILEPNGKAHVLGVGWRCDGGVYYSNDSYKSTRKTYAKKNTKSTYQYYSDDSYSYGGYTGAYCQEDCDNCTWRKYCFSTESDLKE